MRRVGVVAAMLLTGVCLSLVLCWTSALWVDARTTVPQDRWRPSEREFAWWAEHAPDGVGELDYTTIHAGLGVTRTMLMEVRELPKRGTRRMKTPTVAQRTRTGWPLRAMEGTQWTNVPGTPGVWRDVVVAPSWLAGGQQHIPLKVLPVAFASNSLIMALAVGAAVAGARAARCRLRTGRGLCPSCAYPRGESEMCTECGAAVGRATRCGRSPTRSLPMILVVAMAALAGCETESIEAREAVRLIERVRQAYAECGSYRDQGKVVTVFHTERGERTTEKPFSTRFVRPDRFRFEFRSRHHETSPWSRYIVHADTSGVQTWWDIRPGVQTARDLSMALAGAMGVSGGSSKRVPSLLLPGAIGGSPFDGFRGLRRIPDAELNGRLHARLRGLARGDMPVVIWIDEPTATIRRIDTEAKLPDFRTETTTTYEPAMNVELSEEDLAFDPPGS